MSVPGRIMACLAAAGLCAVAAPAAADREPVLKQIGVPHHYYYREMYLPQLTAGPGSLAWSPDGRTLVYSMQGSLWRQDLDSTTATQLTAGPGYDYQPDWSPDGSRIAFVRYNDDALELMLLHLDSGAVTPLTAEGAANVEPRWSPDGRKLAFVSTRDNGRFHLYVGDVVEDALHAEPLFEERVSEIPRYYYSAYDHELSPAWSPDGSEIAYVSNPEIPYGTGAIWRRNSDGSGEPQLVRMEETSWRARPDWAPDGGRIAYASYLGRQWHQLWVTRPEGRAEPFPLTYGDFDISSPRFAPDGRSIAFISNESGGTGIVIQELVGGRKTRLEIRERRYLAAMATLVLRTLDPAGRPVAARVAVTGADGRAYAPDDAWIHADDGFDRASAEFEAQYFHADGTASLSLPGGATSITVWRGPEYGIETVTVDTPAGRETALDVRLRPLAMPAAWKDWVSGDVHVHMNYGGTYRNTPARLVRQARAEDLDVVWNLIVNKEQRIPDIGYFSPDPDPASTPDTLIVHAQEYHTSYWGHMGLIGLRSHLLVPDYSAYPETAAASIYPDNATVSRLAREQGAAVGYVHPFELPPPDPEADGPLTNAFPVDAALGLVDYYEVVGFADPRTSADVWYGLLNCGLRVAAAGGTDAMANFASLRGPVGQNRTYVHVPGYGSGPAEREAAWLGGLRDGRTMATNTPLVGLTVDGRLPGSVIESAGPREVSYRGFLRSAVPVDHLELVQDGKVVRSVDLGGERRSADIEGSITLANSGWLLLRAWNDHAHPQVFDKYPYATTSPVYVVIGNEPARSPRDAAFFTAWVARIRESAVGHADFNSDQERDTIMANLAAAERRFAACR